MVNDGYGNIQRKEGQFDSKTTEICHYSCKTGLFAHLVHTTQDSSRFS